MQKIKKLLIILLIIIPLKDYDYKTDGKTLEKGTKQMVKLLRDHRIC